MPLLRAQDSSVGSGPKRFEFGTKVADMRTGCIGSKNCPEPSFGVGVGGALNLSPHIAVDADFLKTPQSATGETNSDGGHASEFLIGARAEVRAKRYGYYLKAQPGYFRWSSTITSVVYPTPTTFAFNFGPITHFAADIGAGAEYSPGGRFHIRGEVTDLVLRYSHTYWTNDLQTAVGIYVSSGQTLRWAPPIYNARAVHPFWNSTNKTLLAVSLLATTADAITTQQFIKRGVSEGDPLARPFVKYGWSGQISLMSLEIGSETLVMYSLHRMGQHWIERILPSGISLTHGILAYNNTKINKRNP